MSAGGRRQGAAPEPEKGGLARLGAAGRPCGDGGVVRRRWERQEETGLTIRHPRLVGVKQFPIEAGRYVVLLFKAVEWSGTLTSSEEGEMAWIEYSKLPSLQTVDDLEEMLHMMNTPELTEFQYLLRGDEWIMSIK